MPASFGELGAAVAAENGAERPAPGDVGQRLAALVAVGSYDRRAVAAINYARTLPVVSRAAVHVATDRQAAALLGLEWMGSPLSDEPLHIIDDAGGVAVTIAALTRSMLRCDADGLVVVVAQLAMPGIGRRLLHDRTAAAITRAVADIERAYAVLVPVVIRR